MEHKSTLEELEAAVMQDDMIALSAWQTEIVHWESDLMEPNPFESKTNGESLQCFMFLASLAS